MFRELLDHPDVTELCELRGRFGVMAYHGGNLERTTDAVALEVAERMDCSLYAVLQDPPHRIHVRSTAFDPTESERLAAFLEHVDVVIAIHGYGRESLWHHLLLGGRNRGLAGHVAIGNSGVLEQQTHELPAPLQHRPVDQLVLGVFPRGPHR